MNLIFVKEIKKCTLSFYKNYSLLSNKNELLRLKDNPFSFNNNLAYVHTKNRNGKNRYFITDEIIKLEHFKDMIIDDEDKIKKYYNKPFNSTVINNKKIPLIINGIKVEKQNINQILFP